MLDSHREFERAIVTSAVPLDEKQTENITSFLKAIVRKDVSVTNRVDPDILGGFIARVGDQVLDGSSVTKLNEMRKSLSQ
jgi:F-type H+-transporting ATPase subunit delta